MQDTSAVVSSKLIGLLHREDKARLMCSLRPARSAWLVAWPMHFCSTKSNVTSYQVSQVWSRSTVVGFRPTDRMIIIELSSISRLNLAGAGLTLCGSIKKSRVA